MAGVIGDDEEQRVIDRIRANACREAMEEGATFINRKWIAQKLHRSERWVTDNRKKGYEHCFTKFGDGRPEKLSEESKKIVIENSGKDREAANELRKRSSRSVERALVHQLYNDFGLNKG